MNLKEVVNEAFFELGYACIGIEADIDEFESTEELTQFTVNMVRILKREWWKNKDD